MVLRLSRRSRNKKTGALRGSVGRGVMADRRRRQLTLLGGGIVAALPLTASAQQTPALIGFLVSGAAGSFAIFVSQPGGCVSSGRRLCRPHPQGREACGPAGRTADQARAGHQRPDCQDHRPHRAGQVARDRRRGDRIEMLFVVYATTSGFRVKQP
jgi:hypothetical protein